MTLFEQPEGRGWVDHHDPFERLHAERRRRRMWLGLGFPIAVTTVLLLVVLWPYDALRIAIFGLPEPSAEVVAIADKAFLTPQGRDIFYAAQPALGTIAEVRDECKRLGDDNSRTAGCFRGDGRIFIYSPDDPRLEGMVVTTAAHELLHAVYEQLEPDDAVTVMTMIEAELARVPAEDSVHAQIDYSVGNSAASRTTELFAYLGSQIQFDGGFAPELEAVYARYISDRSALVQVARDFDGMLPAVSSEMELAGADLSNHEITNAQESARLEADTQAHEQMRAAYNTDADWFNALTPQQRGLYEMTMTGADGVSSTTSYEEGLRTRLAEIERLRADIETRRPALEAAETEAATRRVELEARYLDIVALIDMMNPGGSGG